jgi:hypothetical protein
MASSVEICNIAISYLGGNKIMDFTDDSTEAELCRLNYPYCRDSVLEEINWTFATKRYRYSSPLADKPAFGYANSFRMPTEILRIISVNDNIYPWALESGEVLTDSSSIDVLAVIRVIDSTKFSPTFVHALASYLAMEICLPLTNSSNQYGLMAQTYAAKMKLARGNDGRQGTSDVRRSNSFRR